MGVSVLERASYPRHPEFISGSQKIASSPSVYSNDSFVWNDSSIEQKSFLERNLAEEIEHIRKNWQKEKLPQNWVDLPGVGFMIGYQMGFLDSEKFKPFSFAERLKRWTNLTASSLRSWVMEYLAERGILAGLQSLKFEDGRLQYKDELHGAGFELDETLSKKEANGLVWDMYINTIKPYFISGTSAVTYSPQGKRMPDESGNLIDYVNSRHTFMEKKGDFIYTYTIANDLEFDEHAEFANEIQKLANNTTFTFTKDSNAKVFITHPTLSRGLDLTLHKVIDTMGKIREKRGKKYIYKNKTAQDLKAEATLIWKEMWEYDQVTERFVREFVDFSLSSAQTKESRKEALAVTILRLSRYVREKERSASYHEDGLMQPYIVTNHSDFVLASSQNGYGDVLSDIKARIGCAGGGKSTSFGASFEVSYETIIGGNTTKKMECVKCPFCEEIVDAIDTGTQIICPSCDARVNK